MNEILLGSAQVVVFVPATDLERAREFHGSILGHALSLTQLVGDATP